MLPEHSGIEKCVSSLLHISHNLCREWHCRQESGKSIESAPPMMEDRWWWWLLMYIFITLKLNKWINSAADQEQQTKQEFKQNSLSYFDFLFFFPFQGTLWGCGYFTTLYIHFISINEWLVHNGSLSSVNFHSVLWSEYASALQCLKGLLEKHNIFFVST